MNEKVKEIKAGHKRGFYSDWQAAKDIELLISEIERLEQYYSDAVTDVQKANNRIAELADNLKIQEEVTAMAGKRVAELEAKLSFALSCIPTDEGIFTFPDGESYPARQALSGKESK
jgi:DNA repair exonuclease SbcCD ATPase subunit